MRPDVFERTTGLPVTRADLVRDLSVLGLWGQRPLLVHVSMSQIGYVVGGADTIIDALIEALGPDGTLVMPAHAPDLSDPAIWQAPPVPVAWHDVIREHMPAFDPARTPTGYLGVVAEAFRHRPGVKRSQHPQVSFCALGPLADEIVGGHGLGFGLGELSPLARLYERGAAVLLLGCDHKANTSLHLAEYRLGDRGADIVEHGAPIMEGGQRRWVTFPDIDLSTDDFAAIGAAFEQAGRGVTLGEVGYGPARLFEMRALVDFAADRMRQRR